MGSTVSNFHGLTRSLECRMHETLKYLLLGSPSWYTHRKNSSNQNTGSGRTRIFVLRLGTEGGMNCTMNSLQSVGAIHPIIILETTLKNPGIIANLPLPRLPGVGYLQFMENGFVALNRVVSLRRMAAVSRSC